MANQKPDKSRNITENGSATTPTMAKWKGGSRVWTDNEDWNIELIKFKKMSSGALG